MVQNVPTQADQAFLIVKTAIQTLGIGETAVACGSRGIEEDDLAGKRVELGMRNALVKMTSANK